MTTDRTLRLLRVQAFACALGVCAAADAGEPSIMPSMLPIANASGFAATLSTL